MHDGLCAGTNPLFKSIIIHNYHNTLYIIYNIYTTTIIDNARTENHVIVVNRFNRTIMKIQSVLCCLGKEHITVNKY